MARTGVRAVILALAAMGLAAAPAHAGFRDSCERARSADERPVSYRICTGTVESFDGTPLDATLTLPPNRGRRLPLVVFLHGFLNDKGEYLSQTRLGTGPDRGDAAYKTIELNNVWFASRGYAVLNYSARGHGGSGGEIGLASKHFEIRDTHHLTGLLVDLGIVHRKRVAVVGGSYGGGQTWLLATVRGRGAREYGSWRSPKGRIVELAAAVPQFTWTDLLQSLVPNGRRGRPAPRDPLGVAKITLLNGFIASLNTKLTDEIVRWLTRVNQGEPYEGDPVVEEAKRALTADRSPLWQTGYFRALRTRRQRSVPILAAQGWTDPIFAAGEAVRMERRLRRIRPRYPIQLYFGDFEHLTAQVKLPDMRYYHRLANRLLDRYLRGRRRRPAFDARSAPTICDPESFGPVVRARRWPGLQPDRLRLELEGARTTGSPILDPRGTAADQVVVGLQRRGCVTTDLPATPGVATWRVALERDFTLIGMPRLELAVAATGPDVQLNARLWDVAPDGTQTLVTRGAYRLVDPPAASRLSYDLYGNHWHFAKGHELMLEVTGDDSTFFRRDNFPSATAIEQAALTLPGRR